MTDYGVKMTTRVFGLPIVYDLGVKGQYRIYLNVDTDIFRV